MKAALFMKKGKPGEAEIINFTREKFPYLEIFRGHTTDSFPVEATRHFDVVISYLSPWIIPAKLLRPDVVAVNFHPGPPEYPGIGCFNFALNDAVTEYGVTCHYMAPQVDTGKIIAVTRFPVSEDESVHSLSLKSYANMQALYYQVIGMIATGKKPEPCGEAWKREPYRRAELEALCRIAWGENFLDIERRINALTYPDMPGAYFEFEGRIYSIKRDRGRERKRAGQKT